MQRVCQQTHLSHQKANKSAFSAENFLLNLGTLWGFTGVQSCFLVQGGGSRGLTETGAVAEQSWLLRHRVVNEHCLTTQMHRGAVEVSGQMG